MLQLSHLEQFKQEVMNLGYGILQKPDKLYALNTVKHKMILVELMQLICVDAEKNSLEEQCLIEIRRLWIMHMLLLASVRNKYKQLNYKKLDRPKEFTYELDLPAFIELQGSATPADNPKIVLDENQQIYLQYLEYAAKIEDLMMMTDWYLSNKLGVIPNFDKITDTQTQKTELSFRIGHDFMIDLSFKGDPERIRTINEAEMCVRESLNEVYVGATSKYYEWLIKSILKFPFPEVEIPDVGQSKSDFIIPYDATKTDLYNKIRYIKRKVYPKAKGSEYLARVFNDSTKNFNDERVLDFVLLKSKM